MAITFLHTADWHIGKPFGKFDSDRAAVLRHARLTAIERIADAARRGSASHVLIGGDTYDGQRLADRELGAVMARIRTHGDLAWHFIPGNHDHDVPAGAWERVRRAGLPSNVHLHLESRPVALTSDCTLLPAPLTARATNRDPTAYMDQAETPPDCVRIGLAHGSVSGFGSEQLASVAIAFDRASKAGLDYLALGDWHGCKPIGAKAWYSGTPEPDGFLDNDPGHALLVRIEGRGAAPVVERVRTSAWSWLSRGIDGTLETDIVALEREVERLGSEAQRTLIQINVRGRITLAADRALALRLDRLEAAVFHLDRRLDTLRLAPEEEDIASLGDGPVAMIATDLARIAENRAAPEHKVAQRALRRLFELATAASAGGDQVRDRAGAQS